MSLPLIQTLEGCADYTETVEPFMDALWELPAMARSSLAASFRDGQTPDLLALYRATNPLLSGFVFSLLLGVVFFLVSEVNGNYSQVDRCWSLLPTFYLGHFDIWARLAGLPTERLDVLLLCGLVWSARLTFNYARKGGYSVGSEDYRWEIVKNAIPLWLFHLFNLTFISFVQSVLLFLLAAPAYVVLLASRLEPHATAVDWVFASVELGLVLVEWLSDGEQWRFQAAKKNYLASAKVPPSLGFTQADLDRGFVTSGLWAYSRHPNFAAEQAIWLVLYQWSCLATDSIYNWSGIGAAFLVMLFQGSTWLTELITARKYPDYKEYQKQVKMFVPVRLQAFQAPAAQAPKVIRTSELAKRAQAKAEKAEKEKAGKTAKASGSQTGGKTRANKR